MTLYNDMKNDTLGSRLWKDKLLSKISCIFPKNLIYRSFPKAIIERQVQFADVSFYEGTIDWNVMSTNANAVIIRAGQNLWIDPEFDTNYTKSKAVGMKRGVYWFYDSRVHPDQQADKLISLIKEDPPEMEIFCDWEYNYGGQYFDLKYAVKFMQRIEALLPGTTVGMYTGYYFFKDHTNQSTHAFEYDYLRNKPLWLAWYVSDPSYVQVPAPWNELTHWQFTSTGDGKGWGCESLGIDLNCLMEHKNEFENKYGQGGSNDEVVDYKNGVVKKHLTRYGADCYALLCDPDKVNFIVTDHFNTLNNAVEENNAFAGINGDGWAAGYSIPNSIAWSKGTPVNVVQYDYRPFFNFSSDSIPEIKWITDNVNFSNTVSGDRFIISNGEINQTLYDRPQEKNARTAVGIRSDNTVVLFKCDGYDYDLVNGNPPKGLGWVELANVGLELGCVDFINLDGGGSSTMWADGSQVGIANDDGVIGLRSTVNHLLVRVGESPPTGGSMTVVSNINGARGFKSAGGSKLIGKIPYNTEVTDWQSSGSYTEISCEPWWFSGYEKPKVWVLTEDLSFGDPTTPPPTGGNFPSYYTLRDPDGNEQIYDKRA